MKNYDSSQNIDFSQPSETYDTSNQSYIVCSFYTPNYKKNVNQLKSSLIEHNINYYLQPISDQGNWESNTRIKPLFLLHCLNRFTNYNIVYLDADAIVRKPLKYFEEVNSDIAIYRTHRQKGMSHEYLTGTIYLRNCPVVLQLVKQWINIQENCKKTMVDQDSFDKAMQLFEDKLVIEHLSLGYIKIFDRHYDGEVFIEQFQASRGQVKLRRQLIRKRNKIIIISFLIVIIISLILVYLL